MLNLDFHNQTMQAGHSWSFSKTMSCLLIRSNFQSPAGVHRVHRSELLVDTGAVGAVPSGAESSFGGSVSTALYLAMPQLLRSEFQKDSIGYNRIQFIATIKPTTSTTSDPVTHPCILYLIGSHWKVVTS